MKVVMRPGLSSPMVEVWHKVGDTNYYHREDGPAFVSENKVHLWYLHNKRIKTKEDYQEKTGLSDCDMLMLILKYGDIS